MAQTQQMTNMTKQGLGFNQFEWQSTTNDLNKLAKLVETGQSLSYSMMNVNDVFKQRFPGYKAPDNYTQEYKQWNATTLDTLRGTLSAAGMQSQNLINEQQRIQKLKNMGQSAQGRMQALQAGNMIAGETVTQLQHLRQVIINQTTAQNTYMAYKVQNEASNDAAMQSWLENGEKSFGDYDSSPGGFGEMPKPNY